MRISLIAAAAFALATALAQAKDKEGEQEIVPVMPDAAKDCAMPDTPAAIGADVDYDTLIAHQGKIKSMQTDLADYRKCLDGVRGQDGMTPGNLMALNMAHDKSVDVEEKAAANFNEAVQKYRKRKN